jgi:nucleoside-diphosphate-sugar epimerase
MEKVIILGASGFVGRNLFEILETDTRYKTLGTSRQKNSPPQYICFDLLDKSTWQTIVDAQPNIIVNSMGYGVVKNETDLATMYQVNYLAIMDFYYFISEALPTVFWVQIGTAFEYDLSIEKLTETSPCVPKTHYGMSKWLFSNFLNQKNLLPFVLIRPFAMFGKYEQQSKIIPYLIMAQIKKQAVDLSSGLQKRDYFFVEDLCYFIKNIFENKEKVTGQTINIGSSKALSLREIGSVLLDSDTDFDEKLWNWGVFPQRAGESDIFYNDSTKAFDFGLVVTPLNLALKNTYMFYKSI